MTAEPTRRGPKTHAGRAAVRRNAIKHGIASIEPVIAGIEEEDDWLRYRHAMLANLAPEGALEEELARTITLTLWRKRRIAFYENAVINHQVVGTEAGLKVAGAYARGTLAQREFPALSPDYVAAHEHTRVLPEGDVTDKIMRYETHLHRMWLQTQRQFDILQARRRGEHISTAIVDFSGSP